MNIRFPKVTFILPTFGTITLFIFLAQFLVTTKIKAKKLVTTKIFGRDQFFCLNFGRDQKLGEENEKGSYLKGECVNQKAKPHKQSLIVGGQNGVQVWGICRFAPEEFGNKD